MPQAATEAYVQSLGKFTRKEHAMEKSPTNHGEGNPEAAEEFNEAEREFVNSARGKKEIRKGPRVQPGEEADLEQAEQRGKARAKNDDSKTKRMNKEP
jgi:hypothetical protein